MMSKSVHINKKILKSENLLSLPPDVNSVKIYGYLEIKIEELKWTTAIKTYPQVKLKVIWWGKTTGDSFDKVKTNRIIRKSKSLTDQKSESLLQICYNINTNQRLFRSYLSNCEPLIIEIYSVKTLDLIGKATIHIPSHLYKSDSTFFSRTSSVILSNRNFKLGEMVISFDIKTTSNCVSENLYSLKTTAEKELEKVYKKQKMNVVKSTKVLNENKENISIKVIGTKKLISARDSKPLKPSTLIKRKSSSSRMNSNTTSSKSSSVITTMSRKTSIDSIEQARKLSLLNFLSGKPMSKNDENKVLSDIATISPSSSIIEEINKIDRKISKNTEIIDTAYINFKYLELNEIGYYEVKGYCNKFRNSHFILKCATTSKLFKANDFNFISSVFDTPSKTIIFNKESMQHIKSIDDDLSNVYINLGFCIKSIEINKYASTHVLGFTRVNVGEMMRSNKMRFCKKFSVINENNLTIGMVLLKIHIGVGHLIELENIKESHYGHCTDDNLISIDDFNQPMSFKAHKVTSHPSTSNDDCDSHDEKHFDNKTIQTDDLRLKSAARKDKDNASDQRDTEMIDVDAKDNWRKLKIYQGILFIESLRNIREQKLSEYFITFKGFWNECQENTELSVNFIFNYLKQFPIKCDDDFLKVVQNNHMELKLWEKTNEVSEKLIATTRVPLHQFYIAFKDIEMIEHLSTNKLPIISTDTWCNFVSPLSNELYCQAKVLLAIGSENQIDYLKLSRNLQNLPPPQRNLNVEKQNINIDANAQMRSKLSAFIESLSQKQKLPEPSGNLTNFQKNPSSSSSSLSVAPSLSSGMPNIINSQPQLRKTSDLLDTLQKALLQPLPPQSSSSPSPNLDPFALLKEQSTSESSSHNISESSDFIKMQIKIECASNLPKIIVKKGRNKRKSKGTPPQQQRSEFEPHAYATFEAAVDHMNEHSLPDNVIKSHEGIVFCTKVIQSCNPEWNQDFEVFISIDVLKNPQKKFVVKIWRKSSPEPTKIDAAPFEDSVIGFSAIDLSVLLTGLPCLSGFYNIVDFSGRSNGHLKISLKPFDDLTRLKSPPSPTLPFSCQLNIDVNSESSNLLSRTLKRKFTELDEITQRLKARLFDVTGDENFDPDEEFERDLNTAVDEMEEENFDKEDFGWLKKDDDNNFQTKPSTSNIQHQSSRETGTGCSSSSQDGNAQFAINDLLKKYDLDTIINPNIFKNILDPNLANSDSTPTLNPQVLNDDANNSCESDVTTVSSITNDQVHSIQRALQRASIHENSDDTSSTTRKDPDGLK